jgi:hypothetical protein
MTVDSRAKGARTETVVRDLLKKYTGLGWERVPGSGALDPKHKLKGDLYVPDKSNVYCVEVKGYADDHVSSAMLTSKTPQIVDFWQQTVRQGIQVDRKPLLIFKHNRSKIFVCFDDMPDTDTYRYLYVNVPPYQFWIAVLDDWITHEKPKFVS